MRVAVLGDIHGNAEALMAVLGHVSKFRPDVYVVLGDIVVGAADSLACWEQVRDLGCPVLRGNHEGYVLRYGTPDAPAFLATPQYAPVAWAAAQLAEVRHEIERLPFSITRPDCPDALFLHASARSDSENISAYTPDEALRDMFAGVHVPTIIRGHDHAAATHPWSGGQLITCGSVGLPLNGITEAQYLLLERREASWFPLFQTVPYDVDGALARFHSTGYLEAAGPMARLFYREVATASYQLTPFLRNYARWSENATLDLEQSVNRFITAGFV